MGNSGIGVPLPELAAYCREAAAEGAVLLKNEGHMLPVKKDETVSIFGRSQIEYYRSGTGSGEGAEWLRNKARALPTSYPCAE